jgi:hypothetical protein
LRKREGMESDKDCFGSITTMDSAGGQTVTQTRSECQGCDQIRDCLRESKQSSEEAREKQELRKQEMITRVIDLSHIFSNDIGSCLLEFLSRIYSTPLGEVLFKNLLIFYEVPKNKFFSTLTIPITRSTLEIVLGQKREEFNSSGYPASGDRSGAGDGFVLRLVLIQKSFPTHRKANMGLIAYEVARMLVADKIVLQQMLDVLPEAEAEIFKNADAERRARWLIERWGLLDELGALQKEAALLNK